MKTNSPRISVIIPTRNRRELLQSCLISLKGLSYPREKWEVIVVDDGSIDGTFAGVKEIKKDFPASLLCYQERENGISAAKNVGINKARGDVLIFTDDDCTFEPGWIEKLINHFDSPAVGMVGGPDRSPKNSSFLVKCLDYTVTSLVGTGGVRRKEGIRMARYYPRGFNMAVSREAIEKVKGFDETLAAGEDIDLAFRTGKAGYALRYAPDAGVCHYRRNSLPAFLKQMNTRGYSRVELIRRHKDLMEPSYLLPPLMVVLLILLLSLSIFSPLIFHISLFLFCLYAIIVFAAGIEGSIRIKDIRALPVIPFLLFMQHFMYGFGFLRALFGKALKSKNRDC